MFMIQLNYISKHIYSIDILIYNYIYIEISLFGVTPSHQVMCSSVRLMNIQKSLFFIRSCKL